MRIPTSVIVMSLVTAAPFAMAVRDTLHPQPKHQTAEEQDEAALQAELQRDEANRQANEDRRHTVFKGLLGDKGTLGPYLDNLTLGASREQVTAIQQRIAPAEDIVYLTSVYDAEDKLSSLSLSIEHCDELREQIRSQWGDGTQWIDSAAHVKVTIDGDYNCSLGLTRYVEMEQFLDKTVTASIPLGAVGKPTSQLPLADDATLHRPGLEHTGEVLVRPTTSDDESKIVGLSVSFPADVEADEPIRARLDKLLGKGTQDPDTGEWSWKGKTPVHYAYSDAHVYIDIGQP